MAPPLAVYSWRDALIALFIHLTVLLAYLPSPYIGITSLQHPNGSFSGDEGGEIDTRFTFCALACVDLLKRAHISCSDIAGINQETALSYVGQCRNADGGYGAVPGGESHAGQIFCCVGTRAIVGDVEELADQEKSYPFRPDNAGMKKSPYNNHHSFCFTSSNCP